MKYKKIQERIITKVIKKPKSLIKNDLYEIYRKDINNFNKLNEIIDLLLNPKSNFYIDLYIKLKEQKLVIHLFMFIYKNTYYLKLDLVIIEYILEKIQQDLYNEYLKFKYFFENHILPFIHEIINPYFIDLYNEIFFYRVYLFTLQVLKKKTLDQQVLEMEKKFKLLIPEINCWKEYFGENYKKYKNDMKIIKIVFLTKFINSYFRKINTLIFIQPYQQNAQILRL